MGTGEIVHTNSNNTIHPQNTSSISVERENIMELPHVSKLVMDRHIKLLLKHKEVNGKAVLKIFDDLVEERRNKIMSGDEEVRKKRFTFNWEDCKAWAREQNLNPYETEVLACMLGDSCIGIRN